MILNFYLSKRVPDSIPTPSRYKRKNSEYENHLKVCKKLGIDPSGISYHKAIEKLSRSKV